MESMMTLNRRSFAWVFSISPSWTFPATPGMREAIRCMGPIPVSMSICSYISWRVNFPAMIFLVSSSAFFSSIASWAFSRRDSRSPIPRRREMKRGGSNRSRSSIFSPTPTKTIGARTSATAESAPPPFAVPSSFVTMTPVTPTAAWNAFPCGPPRLPDRRVDPGGPPVGAEGLPDGHDLRDEVGLEGVAARRVDDEDVRPFEGLEACPHDADRVLLLPVPVEAHLDLVRELLELLVRRGAAG